MKQINFNRFEFDFGLIPFHKHFMCIELLPSLSFIINKQGRDTFEVENKIYPGRIEYQLGFNWLIFYVYITLSIKTKQPWKPF